jgi:hypothetical protein
LPAGQTSCMGNPHGKTRLDPPSMPVAQRSKKALPV